jgi:cell division protein FtsA
MIRNITVGIDIGTYATRVVVGEYVKGENLPRIIGTGFSESSGLRFGYITNMDEAIKSIRRAVADAEKNTEIKIRRAYISVSGISLSCETSVGSAIISKADKEVTKLDVEKAIAESEDSFSLANRKIIHTVPIQYKLDSKEIMGRPEGMKGIKLEVRTLGVTYLEQHLEDLISAVSQAGVEVLDVVASPIASSLVTLSEKQRTAGCVLVDIGAETVSSAVFENGKLFSLQVFSIGSTDITKDIALGLRIPLEEAENIKLGQLGNDYPKRKIDEIVDARLSDIFELIENHLKKIKRAELLPAGVIITGGGAHIQKIEELSRHLLKLPSRIGTLETFTHSKNRIKDSSWFVASGLCLWGKAQPEGKEDRSLGSTVKGAKHFFKSILDQLLP